MIWLASNSPRRQELLKLITTDFLTEAADLPESLDNKLAIESALEKLAYEKALPIFRRHSDDIVIGADTVVVHSDQILGKPDSREEAFMMLKSLSGDTHTVITGVSIISAKISIGFHEKTEVTFYPLSEAEIDSYITEWKPYDKAGAYGIQDKAAVFVKAIQGCYYNVMGLPVARLNQELNRIKELSKAK